MSEIVISIVMYLTFAFAVFPVVILHVIASLILLRLFSQYPDVQLKEYWMKHKKTFAILWICIPFILSFTLGYFWYVMFCVDLLLPPIPEMRYVALVFMTFILCVLTNYVWKLRTKKLKQDASD